MVENMEKLKAVLENKARFVKMVTDEELVVFKKKKVDLEQELVNLNFVKIDESFDYLLSIKTYQYTLEEMDKLYAEASKVVTELQQLKGTSVIDMYKSDLEVIS